MPPPCSTCRRQEDPSSNLDFVAVTQIFITIIFYHHLRFVASSVGFTFPTSSRFVATIFHHHFQHLTHLSLPIWLHYLQQLTLLWLPIWRHHCQHLTLCRCHFGAHPRSSSRFFAATLASHRQHHHASSILFLFLFTIYFIHQLSPFLQPLFLSDHPQWPDLQHHQHHDTYPCLFPFSSLDRDSQTHSSTVYTPYEAIGF